MSVVASPGGDRAAAAAPPAASPVDRALLGYRMVQLGLLFALMWKWSFFVGADAVYRALPLRDAFFPDWLQSGMTLRVAFLSSVVAIGLSVVTARRRLRQLSSVAAFAGISVLCLHQGSYNDMTFVTAWWTGLWSLWFAHRLHEEDQSLLLRRAAFLGRLILSMILLGGAVGKWTPEYWSGEVLFDIYFRDRDFWVFNWLRASCEPQTLREIATWYSRKVIVIETMCGFGLWLLPPRWAAVAGVSILGSIALFSNFLLFSVLLSLIALSAVGFLVPAGRDEPTPGRG